MMNKVLIVIGSKNDYNIMKDTTKIFDNFGIKYDIEVASAHRTPERVRTLAITAVGKDYDVIIAAASMSAHLAGVISGYTTLPVIGVPIDCPPLNGLDSLLSTVQMPSGVPVATVSIGKAGAKNSALLAIRIMAVYNLELKVKLENFTKQNEKEIEKITLIKEK